jgi:cell division initiation protein
MKITPVDLAHKSFTKKMFGVDENEVSDFLSQVASTLEDLIHERNSLREKLREKDINLVEYKERDSVLKNTITTAGQMADRIRQDSEREGKLIVADAHQKAEMLTRDARDSLKKMYQEISDLKRMRLQFEANLRAVAQAHLALIEQGEKFLPVVGLPNASLDSHWDNQRESQRESARTNEISPLSSKNI